MAETPSPLSDPRYRAGVRLRRGGRFEAAANLLAEVLTLATEGAPDERQLDPALAPLYYEYGVALVGVAREAAAAEEDAEAAPSPKRRRLAGEAGGEDADDDDDDEENADDAAVAWQLVDQARCLFLEAGDRAAAARCAEQLAGLAVDQRKWADAVAEFSLGVEFYDAAADLDIEDRVHHLSCVAGLAAALGAHFAESPAADVAVNVDGRPEVVVAAAEVADRCAAHARDAERGLNALLGELAAARATLDAARKRDLCALAVEVSHAKDVATGLAAPAPAPG